MNFLLKKEFNFAISMKNYFKLVEDELVTLTELSVNILLMKCLLHHSVIFIHILT